LVVPIAELKACPYPTGAPIGIGAIAAELYPAAITWLLPDDVPWEPPELTLPTTPEGAPIAGVSSFVTFSSAAVSAHATAASENTARAATSNHVAGFLIFTLLMTKSFELLVCGSAARLCVLNLLNYLLTNPCLNCRCYK
jgi:hypothetical protein